MTQRRRTRRIRGIALRVVVFLLLGAIVNVAVAWGCVLTLPPQWNGYAGYTSERVLLRTETVAQLDDVYANASIFAEGQYGRAHSRFGWTRVAATWSDDEGWHYVDVGAVFAGWPRPSVQGCSVSDQRPGSSDALSHRGLIRVPEWVRNLGNRRRVEFIPISPIWPGFAINTVFYAAILWLLFAAPGRVRRWRRIRRGLCAKCAYPVGTSEVCTECGAAIRPGGAAGCSHVYESTLRVK